MSPAPGSSRATLFLNGTWRPAASGATFVVCDPARREPIAECSNGGREDAQAAVDAACSAFLDWAATPPADRADLLLRLASLLQTNAGAMADLLVSESGKPIRDARAEAASCVESLSWSAEAIRRGTRRVVEFARDGRKMWTVRQPVGVVAVITPWNYPLNTLVRKIAPALAAGCSVVIKPAPETPLSTVEFCCLTHEAGFPPGVVNLVTSDRAADVAGVWLEDARVRKIAFTGSTAVGKSLLRGAAGSIKRVTLEVGGLAPAIVFADADLERAAAAIVASGYRHAGQTCICVQRVLIERSILAPLRERIVERVRSLRVANGRDENADLGPLIHAAALGRVQEHVRDAVSQGAVLAAGGNPLRLPPDAGFYFEPTVLDGVRPPMKITREETFGPVLGLSAFDTEEEAVREANSTRYGLVAYVFTADEGRALRLTRALDFGVVGINDVRVVAPELPFGGMKESGLGRENGEEGLAEYFETKSIVATVA